MCVLQAFVQNEETTRLSHGVKIDYKKIVQKYDTITSLENRVTYF